MGQMEIIADKVEFGAKISADKFKVPAGYTIMDQPAQQTPQMPSEAPAEAQPKAK